jgi:hypothetical protein
VSDIEYNKGFEAGKNFARNQVLDFIEIHLEQGVPITSEDIATEIEYMQRQDIRERNDG